MTPRLESDFLVLIYGSVEIPTARPLDPIERLLAPKESERFTDLPTRSCEGRLLLPEDKVPVVVLSAGVLGRRIAAVWAAGGFDVHVRDPSAEQRTVAVYYVETNTEAFDKYVPGKSRGKVLAFDSLDEAVQNAWLVIESVPEKLSIKIATFAGLDSKAPTDCIFCSHSSSYKSSEMIEQVSPETRKRVLNMHYMMPPDNRILELMTDGQTHPEIFPFLVDILHSIDMHPIVARKESTGFVFNRMWAAIKWESLTILSEGVSLPAELDSVWKEMFGSKQGPCEMMDGVGLDTVEFIERHYMAERGLSGEKTVDYLRREYIDKGQLGGKMQQRWPLSTRIHHETINRRQR